MDDGEGFELAHSAYAVRAAEDRQVVGVFVAIDLDQLGYLVDQCCDPAGAEYLKLGVGGVYVGGATDAQWPARDVLHDGEPVDVVAEDADPFRGAELDDFWWRDMNEGDWIPLLWKESLSKRTPGGRKPTRKR